MRKTMLVAIFSLVGFWWLLVGCQTAGAPGTKSSNTAIPTPVSGKGTVAGWIVNKSDGKPYANGGLNLAKVYRNKDTSSEGAFVLDVAHSPGAVTKPDGTFVIQDIDAGEYVLVIGQADGPNEVYLGADNKPKVWKVDGGKVLDMGEVQTNMNP